MNRPLALIEGDLAFPKPRPFDGLPPPFGSRRRVAWDAAQRQPQLAAQTAAQQAIQDAVQRKPQPARTSPVPLGVKHILFYKTPPQRTDPHRFDAELAEAKRYLEMGKTRWRSSRSDHVLAASIFAGCTIALTWLLVTCSMKDAEKAKAVPVAPTVLSVASPRGDHPKPVATAAVAETQMTVTVEKGPQPVAEVASVAPAKVALTSPEHITQVVPRQAVQVTSHADDRGNPSAKAAKRAKAARLSEAQVNERVALSRAVAPVTRSSVSKQPEWTARASAEEDTFDKAALLNWAAQQRAHVTTRAAVPIPGDSDWNARMTQRRITDNPEAFRAGSGTQQK
ncbi:hypothetical protein PQQ52_06820 [Paraburkholderia sediminicola]|uniref:hypothetical protein n=1 Tax=Paraburkholderia sediminicola TaxID=458836 RepID=UPI0038BB1B56